MNFWERMIEQLYRSTGLSPVPAYTPVSTDSFIANFSAERLTFNPEALRTPTILSNVFDAGVEALKKINNLPDIIRETANNLGLKVSRLILPTGQDISIVKDSNGNEIDGAKIGMTSDVVKKVTKSQMPTLQERQKASEMKAAYRLVNEKSSAEYAALSEFINPFREDGSVKAGARFGWDGLIRNIGSTIPVPANAPSDGVMSMVVNGNTAYLGVCVLQAHASQSSSLQAMLGMALDMELPIPARADGTPWNLDSPIDREAAVALCGTKASPFVAGGKPLLTEGTPILLNDRNLIRMNALSSELTPTKLNENMVKIGEVMKKEYSDAVDNASTPEQRVIAQNSLNGLENNSVNFSPYEQSMVQRHLAKVSLRDKAAQERKANDNKRRLEAASRGYQDNTVSRTNGVAPEMDDFIPPNKVDAISYDEIRERLPNWEPGHRNISFAMKDGVLDMSLFLDDATQDALNISMPHSEIKDIAGFEIEHLKPGSYPVHGAEDAFVNVFSEDGVKQKIFVGLEDDLEKEAPEIQPKLKAQAITREHTKESMEMAM